MTAEYKLSLPMLSVDSSGANGRAVLDKAKKQVGFIPNMYAGMVNSPACWKPISTDMTGSAKARG